MLIKNYKSIDYKIYSSLIFFISIFILLYTPNTFAKEVFLMDIKPITKDQKVQHQALLKQAEKLGITEEDLEVKVTGLALTFNLRFSEIIEQVKASKLPYHDNYILSHATQNSILTFKIRNRYSDSLDEKLRNIKSVYDTEKAKQPDRNKQEANKLKYEGNKLKSAQMNIENKISKFNDYLGPAKVDYDIYAKKVEENKESRKTLLAKMNALDNKAAIEINEVISSKYPTIAPIKVRKKNNILDDIKESKPNKKTNKCKQKKSTYLFAELSSEFNSCVFIKIKKDWISKEDLLTPIKKRAKEFLVLSKEYKKIKSDKSVSKKQSKAKRIVKNMTANAPSVLGFEVKKLDKELSQINKQIAKHDERIKRILNTPFAPYDNYYVTSEIESFKGLLFDYHNEIAHDQIRKNNVNFTEFDEWEFSVPNDIEHTAFFYKLSSNLKTEKYGFYAMTSTYNKKIEISDHKSRKLISKYDETWDKTEYVKSVFYYLTM
ncbi:MAG: hypothetical protein WBC60_00010 [Cognaticolwellia sp.]